MADIVDIKAARAERANGNGAREAMSAALAWARMGLEDSLVTEAVLMKLWELGFKVVPLEDSER